MARLALESTILTHGVPRDAAMPLARELAAISRRCGAEPAVVGIYEGKAIAGLSNEQIESMLAYPNVAKANSANLGALMHQGAHASTTVAATMEIAAAHGIRVFSTGGIGGVHHGFAQRLDISADLFAFTRFPVAVVASGVKSILDVESTRELLETLGVPVVGYRTSAFPAFYLRESDAEVDVRFDDAGKLADFVGGELRRTGRGILIANPIPNEFAMRPEEFSAWLRQAQAAVGSEASGRDATPRLLGALHRVSGGKTLSSNLALIRANTELGATLAASL